MRTEGNFGKESDKWSGDGRAPGAWRRWYVGAGRGGASAGPWAGVGSEREELSWEGGRGSPGPGESGPEKGLSPGKEIGVYS